MSQRPVRYCPNRSFSGPPWTPAGRAGPRPGKSHFGRLSQIYQFPIYSLYEIETFGLWRLSGVFGGSGPGLPGPGIPGSTWSLAWAWAWGLGLDLGVNPGPGLGSQGCGRHGLFVCLRACSLARLSFRLLPSGFRLSLVVCVVACVYFGLCICLSSWFAVCLFLCLCCSFFYCLNFVFVFVGTGLIAP